MTNDEPLTIAEYAYGCGYTDALERVADDLHIQYHTEVEKHGNGDARAIAFFETSQVLKKNVKAIREDHQRRGVLQDD